ncbi:MAG: cobalt-precorrin-6A reductase [Pseudorhodobacter sp.]|nr:cobalt-precorrin-6A reductase [Pseudorhodobacter sp.]
MARILLLGGTTEASALARALAEAGRDAVFSYAGRTAEPVAQPLPTRVGGFGGVAGLCAYVQAEGITHLIDATHPFAAGMSRNAHAACESLGLPLIALERPAWAAQAGDRWHGVADMEAALQALPDAPARVFLAIGKQQAGLFAARPQHHYLLRLVDAPEAPPLPDCRVVLGRGPFTTADDLALLQEAGITHVVAKNAGGSGARAKLEAARALGLPVIMVERPILPPRRVVQSVTEAMAWLDHG